jgi:MFS family permease
MAAADGASGGAGAGAGLLRRNHGFARLATADVVSPLGDAMGTVGLILHLQATRGTGTAVATVLIAESLPPLVSPWLGVVADRLPARRVLVGCSVAQFVAMAVAAWWLPGLAGLFALVLVRASFATVASAAAGAAVPGLVDDDDLPAANAVLGGARELGVIVGPPLAGLLFAAAGGVRTVLAVDAATFLLVVPLLAGVRLPAVTGESEDEAAAAQAVGPSSIRADALEGLRQLWGTPVLRGLAVAFWISVLAGGADDLVLPFLGAEDLGAGPFAIGVLLAGASIGLVAGLVALARWGRRWPALGAVLVGFAVTATGNLLTAFAPVVAVAVATQVVRGGGIALIEANARTLVQRTVPRAVLGRVLANLYGGVGVAAALSYAIGGPLLDATSPRVMFVVLGVAGLAGAGVGAVVARAGGRDEGAP